MELTGELGDWTPIPVNSSTAYIPYFRILILILIDLFLVGLLLVGLACGLLNPPPLYGPYRRGQAVVVGWSALLALQATEMLWKTAVDTTN